MVGRSQDDGRIRKIGPFSATLIADDDDERRGRVGGAINEDTVQRRISIDRHDHSHVRQVSKRELNVGWVKWPRPRPQHGRMPDSPCGQVDQELVAARAVGDDADDLDGSIGRRRAPGDGSRQARTAGCKRDWSTDDDHPPSVPESAATSDGAKTHRNAPSGCPLLFLVQGLNRYGQVVIIRGRRELRRRDGPRAPNPRSRRGHMGERGQGITEFALVVPVLLLLVIAIADFGRLYTSMVAVELAAREAADYGSFKASYWTAANAATTAAEAERRACTAAAGSHLEGYAEPAGTVNHETCTNPSVVCTIEPSDGSAAQDCATYDGTTGNCADSATEPPCVVHVKLTYTFGTILSFPPLPTSVTFTRDSMFRVSDLPIPTAGP